MTYPAYIREKARQMRIERRMTLDEIAERLAIPKTTVWYWIEGLPLAPPGKAFQTPKRTAARLHAAQANSNRAAALRDAAYSRGWREYEQLIDEPGFRDFVCMYIGEGYKRSRNVVSIANSDPRVIDLANLWLRRLSPDKRVSYSVQYHADQDLDQLRRFWAFRVGVEPDQIRLQRKSNSGRLAGRTWRSKWGVLTVTVSDTYLRARLQAWIHRVSDSWLDSITHGV